MDPGRAVGWGGASGLPRARGDGPRHPTVFSRVRLAPPPTRGWTLDGEVGWGRGEWAPPPTRGWTLFAEDMPEPPPGSPAHAGMDPSAHTIRRTTRRLPRPRGDGPWRQLLPMLKFAAPPPTRGWTRFEGCAAGARPGSPAHAGMDPASVRLRCASRRLPRPRGDGPFYNSINVVYEEASPPTRGWTPPSPGAADGLAGSPVHAGMDSTR